MDRQESRGDAAEKRQQHLDLLNQTHDFPQPVMIKVIGHNTVEFVSLVTQTVRIELSLSEPPATRNREAAGGRHIAITMEPMFASAEQVLDLYEALRELPDVVMLL